MTNTFKSLILLLIMLLAIFNCPYLSAQHTAKDQPPFRPLPVFDASKVNPSMFTDKELDLADYLVHFSDLAGSIVESGRVTSQ